MPTFGANLQRLRKGAGFRTARQLADELRVVPSVISKMENDQQGLPEGPTLLKLAKALHCSVDQLLDGVDPDYRAVGGIVKASGEDDALILDAPGSEKLAAQARALLEGGTAPADFSYELRARPATKSQERAGPGVGSDEQAYAIVLRADSMEPLLKKGMRLLVSPAPAVSDGDLAYVHLKSGERLVKIVTRNRNGWWLSAANPAYPPRFVSAAQVVTLHRIVVASLVR